MTKKILGHMLKTCWILFCLVMPTLIILTYSFHFKSLIFLYVSSLILTGIAFYARFFTWKKPYSLLALCFGFLFIMVSHPLAFYLKGGALWHFYGGFFGPSFEIIVWGMIYACPFAILSFLPTIPAIIRWHKKRRQSIAADKTVDSTESEVTDETVR